MTSVSVQRIIKKKGSDVWTVAPNKNAFKALGKMAEKNIGALLVVEDEEIVGIFSERDYARKVILHGKSSKKIAVSEIMTKKIVTVTPEMTADDCMSFMTNERVRHLPVVENGNLLGIVSIGDVVNAIISELDSEIKQLKDYLSSTG